MIAILADGDSRALERLAAMMREIPEIAEVVPFLSGTEALRWAQTNRFDVAILDADPNSVNGLELAQRLREREENCGLIFYAASGRFALDAFHIHADGYLLKPVMPDRLRAEIEYLCRRKTADKPAEPAPDKTPDKMPDKPAEKLLTVKCCGGFDVYDKNGNPVTFRRSRSRELLALLVDRRGMSITSKEICAIFWEDDGERDQKNMAHLWQLFSELNRALRQAGAEGVVRRSGANHFVDMALLDCPDLEQGRKNRDELCYMVGYSWADTADD